MNSHFPETQATKENFVTYSAPEFLETKLHLLKNPNEVRPSNFENREKH